MAEDEITRKETDHENDSECNVDRGRSLSSARHQNSIFC